MKLIRRAQLLKWPFSKLVQKTTQLEVDIRKTAPSVVLSEYQPATPSLKSLTPQQKQQLGIMIVRPPFNPRMSLDKQLAYLPALTTDLYARQQQELQQKVRILELSREDKQIDMLKLTNVVYKDIYARYLIARGFGVIWQGDNSSVGAMNPHPRHDISAVYQTYLKLFKEAELYVKKVPTLYSLTKQAQVPDEEVSIEAINRMGSLFLSELVDFGEHEHQFRPLKEKNGRISLVLFAAELWPVLSMKAVCMKPDTKYIILKHEEREQYYVTAYEHFKSQGQWFDKQKFAKHLLVDGKDFNKMKVKSPTGEMLPIIMELEEYNREYASRIYPVVPAHVLSDYERAQHYKLSLSSAVQTDGFLNLADKRLDIRKQQTETAVKEHLQQTGLLLSLMDVCQQEIFLADSNREQLFLLPVDRLFVRIPARSRQKFLGDLSLNCTIQESKVEIPKMPLLRGKYRRRFLKNVDRLLEQRTEYQTLEQVLKLQEFCISTTADQAFPVPVFFKKGQLVMPKGCSDKLTELSQKGPISMAQVQQLSEPTTTKKLFSLSKDFVKASLYIAKLDTPLKNVIIEPQSETESMLKYSLTLAASLNCGNISFIKLHPTIDQNHRSLSVETMILGAYKANDTRQYGYGFDAFRLWVAKKDDDKGDRILKEIDITAETTNATFLRKCYWQIISYLKHINPSLIPSLEGKDRDTLPFFDRFMLDQCDYFIANMDKSYSRMDLHKLHVLTIEFFRDVVLQIYLNSVTKRLIAYPKQNLQHLAVFKRLLQCLAVIAPLIPFSAMHVSSESYLRWPVVRSLNVDDVELYNNLMNFRAELRNKLKLNKLYNALVYFDKAPANIPEPELALLMDVRKVVYSPPEFLPPEKFSLKRTLYSCKVYFYDETCYRCDPKHGKKDYLCVNCQQYLQKHPQPRLQSN